MRRLKRFFSLILTFSIVFLRAPLISVFADAPFALSRSPLVNGFSNQHVSDTDIHELTFYFASGSPLPNFIYGCNNGTINSFINTYGSFGIFGTSVFSFDPTAVIKNGNNFTCRYQVRYWIKNVWFPLDTAKILSMNDNNALVFANFDDAISNAGILTVDVPANSSLNIGTLQYNAVLYTYDNFINSGQYTPYDGLNVFLQPRLTFCVQVSPVSLENGVLGDDFIMTVSNNGSGISFQGVSTANSVGNTYLCRVTSPMDIPDFRFLLALRNIWSAINGMSTTGNLNQTVQNEFESLENSYDNSVGLDANSVLSNGITELDQTQDFAIQYMDNLDGFTGFDFQETEDTLQAMRVLSDGATSLMDSVSLVGALVIGGITFFIIAVIIGVRRYI